MASIRNLVNNGAEGDGEIIALEQGYDQPKKGANVKCDVGHC